VRLIQEEHFIAKPYVRHSIFGQITDLEIGVVIASTEKADLEGVRTAAGIPKKDAFMIVPREFASRADYGDALLDVLLSCDIVAQLGHLPMTPDVVVKAFPGRIFNQHGGGLDPMHIKDDGTRRDFGGKGMHGMATHAAMFYFGQDYLRRSGEEHWDAEVSSHHVIPGGIDNGDLIDNKKVRLSNEDTLEGFHQRLIAAEHALQIGVLAAFGTEGIFPVWNRPGPLIPDWALPLLATARQRAIQEFPKG
jgi:folate-dependent phosphoribosylglycinamide formyltransferase PurN